MTPTKSSEPAGKVKELHLFDPAPPPAEMRDELEALIVVRDKGGQTQCTTSLVPEDDDGEHV